MVSSTHFINLERNTRFTHGFGYKLHVIVLAISVDHPNESKLQSPAKYSLFTHVAVAGRKQTLFCLVSFDHISALEM